MFENRPKNAPRNALITGGAKRLGRDIAIALGQDGWNVAVHYNTTSPDTKLSLQADLTDFKQLRNLIPQANKALGGEITLLINNASLFEKIKFLESDENAYDSHMDLHVKAPFFLAQDFALQNKSGGQIINMVDSFVCRNKAEHFAYLLSKKSLRDLSKMLALELAPKIQVNAIFPGALSDYIQQDSAYLQNRLAQLPAKKFATSREVTQALIYLVNSSQTGQEIFIDGGEHLI